MSVYAVWTKEKCLAYLDHFIQSMQRHPRKEECTPRNGLPSDTAFRAYVGTGVLSYCREHYPEYSTVQTYHAEPLDLEAACGLWCETLAEHPERASGKGFSMFYKKLIMQESPKEHQEAMPGPKMGGIAFGG